VTFRSAAHPVGATLARALARGFGEWQVVSLLLALNLGVALVSVAPVVPRLASELGHAPLAEGQPLLSAPVAFAVFAALREARPSVLAPLGLLAVLQLFLAGGIARRAWLGGPFSTAEFFAASGRLFARNLRLACWSALGLVAVGAVAFGSTTLLVRLGHWPLFTLVGWVNGSLFDPWNVLQLALLTLCFAAWRLGLESARVLLWRDDLRRTRLAAWRGLGVALRAPLALLAFAALLGAAILGVFLLARFRASLPEGTVRWAVLAFLVGQGTLWVRYAFQVAGAVFAAEQLRRP